MNKWTECDNAFRAFVEWGHSRFSGVERVFTGSRKRLRQECIDIVWWIADVWLRAWGEYPSTFNREYFFSHIRNGLNQAVRDYLLYRVKEPVHRDGKGLCKPSRVHLRNQIRSVFFSTMIEDAPWNIRDMMTLHRLTCIWKSISCNFLFLPRSLTCEAHFRSELKRRTHGLEMTTYRVPVIQVITFIQCMQPR